MSYQVIYSSQATMPFDIHDIEEILTKARVRNESLDITGVLIYVDGVFIQVLEGKKDRVLELMRSIESDPRHSLLKLFYQAEMSTRTFDDWRMANVDVTREQMAKWYDLDGTAPMEQILEDIQRAPSKTPQYIKNILTTIGSGIA
jgi:hypothetical protein